MIVFVHFPRHKPPNGVCVCKQLQTEAKACPIVRFTMDKGSTITFDVPEVLALGRVDYALCLGTPGRTKHEYFVSGWVVTRTDHVMRRVGCELRQQRHAIKYGVAKKRWLQ